MTSSYFDFDEDWFKYGKNNLTAEKVGAARKDVDKFIGSVSLKGKTVLEVGFGQGLGSFFAPEAGAEVLRIDLGKRCLEGWVEKSELVRTYRKADCFINFSSYEGMQNTVLEAMSCGVPVIVSNIESHKEIIDHGASGFLINFDEPNKIFSSVRVLIENSFYAKKGELKGRKRGLRNYSWITLAEKYLNLGLKESNLRDCDE